MSVTEMHPERDRITQILVDARARKENSDVHIGPDSKPYLRRNGRITLLDDKPIRVDEIATWLKLADSDRRAATITSGFSRFISDDNPDTGPLRVTMLKSGKGHELAIRLLPLKPPPYASLNMPKQVGRILKTNRGLTALSGPVGSGKSTLLAAVAKEIGDTTPNLIYVIEDSREYAYENGPSLFRQHTVGPDADFDTFEDALVAMKSGDGDIVICSEALTPSALMACLDLAEAGFNVFTTLHVESASQAPDRIIGAFPADRQNHVRTLLASALQNVIVMRLVPLADGSGRIPVCEVLHRTPALEKAILKPTEDSSDTALYRIIHDNPQTMCLLEDQLVELCTTDPPKITVEDARKVAARPEVFEEKLNKAGKSTSGPTFSL